jgi:hypothetical protein
MLSVVSSLISQHSPRRRPLAFVFLIVVAAASGANGASPYETVEVQRASTGPQWQRATGLCRQLRSEGWAPADPLGGEDAGDGEARIGGALDIRLCRVVRALPATAGGRPSQLAVFLQHRGGDAMNVTVGFFDARDRRAALDAGAAIVTRLTRELRLPAPAGLETAIRVGDDWQDDIDGLRIRVSTTTRQAELVMSPDLKPESVPLLSVEISIGAAEDDA